MVFLGPQLVITLVMVSLIQKLGPHYSFARWLLCSTGLFRYLYPTNDELRALAGVPKETGKSKSKRSTKHLENGKTAETFHVPRNLDIQLETAPITYLDVIHLKYYTEYSYLLDFALYSGIVYIATELSSLVFHMKGEMNMSIFWCLVVVGFATKLLLSLTTEYFKSEESVGERSTVVVMGFAYLLVAMMVLIVDEERLEVGLDTAYRSFNASACAFLELQGLNSTGPASKIVLKFFMALWCAMIGALFTFPGLRMAKMHWDCLKYCRENFLLRLLLNVSFASPFVAVLLWVRPVARDYLTARVFSGMTEPLMSERVFDSLRVCFVVATVLSRLAAMPVYLQAYLNIAYHRVEQQKKEAGRITNVELQKKIAAVFYYLCVVMLQYIAPLLICLYLTLTYKTLGGYSWLGAPSNVTALDGEPVLSRLADTTDNDSLLHTAEHFTLTLDSLKQIFTTEVLRGFYGFTTWWTCFALFASTSLGMVYQSYFSHA
ncbi:transmembrane protein 161B [Bacillus rossius redtenbacheri]|uniref:transmembrane protein 161B n=1 Tax=Bacillus rossius redtenbacheri TaxID=93214 RepID=UPI002FDD9565